MEKNKYSEKHNKMNVVLKHQDDRLKKLSAESKETSIKTSAKIAVLEEKCRQLGIDTNKIKDEQKSISAPKKNIIVPSLEQMYSEARTVVGDNCELEDLFTEEELKNAHDYIVSLRNEYDNLHKLDKYDIIIAALAGLVAGAVDILLVGIPQRSKDGLKGGPLSNYIRDYFDKVFPPEEMEKLANSKESKVPFDAQDNRNTTVHVEGLSAYYHRLLQLGHDPILGFVVGVMDIMSGKMTTIDKAGHITSQLMENHADRVEPNIFKAFAKEFAHLKSDVTTSMGLPAPFMSLFNLLQFGSIGEEEQTIAEIVQGMYYEGYDFIQFCSSSIPVMLAEVVVRLCYTIKRIKEGHKIKDSIPFSLNREKHPKLETMLFIAHSVATSINVGKLYFTQNPVSINYPQWMTFAKYSYKQLKWGIIEYFMLRKALNRTKESTISLHGKHQRATRKALAI